MPGPLVALRRLVRQAHAAAARQATPDCRAVRRALRRLPAPARAAVTLVHLDGLPPAEAAARLGCSEQALKACINRALIELQRQIA